MALDSEASRLWRCKHQLWGRSSFGGWGCGWEKLDAIEYGKVLHRSARELHITCILFLALMVSSIVRHLHYRI